MQIITYDLPEPYTESGFYEEILKGAKNYLAPERGMLLGSRDSTTIRQMLSTGSRDLDKKIVNWINTKGDDWLCEAWELIFTSKAGSISELIQRSAQAEDYALFGYLICLHLSENVQDDAKMPLKLYREIINQTYDACKSACATHLNVASGLTRDGILVKNRNVEKKTITVNGPVYRQWIKTGGDNDTLLGMLVSENFVSGITSVDEQTEKFRKAWDTYLRTQRVALSAEYFNDFLTALKHGFMKSLNNLYDEEQEFSNKNSNHKDRVIQIFEQELKKIDSVAVKDTVMTVSRIVCRARFYYTDAEKYIILLFQILRDNPQMQPCDAAAHCDVDYVAEFIANQVVLR